jgi:hypothetical protein
MEADMEQVQVQVKKGQQVSRTRRDPGPEGTFPLDPRDPALVRAKELQRKASVSPVSR